MGALPLDGEGHRARLRERLLEGGGDALLDHELVEYLLGLSIRRGDTKPLAKRLLNEFGGIGGLLSADPDALRRVGKLSDTTIAALRIAKVTAIRLLQAEARSRPVLNGWAALIDYLHADMAHTLIERVRVIHLDSGNMILRDEVVSEGSIDQAAVHVREVVRRAIDLGSASLILVHNHSSGDPKPSKQDIQLTRQIVEASRPLGITVHDHVIIGAKGHSSFRALGLI